MTRICNTIESNNFGHYVFIQIVTTFAPKFCMKTSYPKENIKILLLEGVSPTATALFEKAGYSDIESLPKAISEEALIERLQDGVHLLGIRSKTQLTAKVLSNAHIFGQLVAFALAQIRSIYGMHPKKVSLFSTLLTAIQGLLPNSLLAK